MSDALIVLKALFIGFLMFILLIGCVVMGGWFGVAFFGICALGVYGKSFTSHERLCACLLVILCVGLGIRTGIPTDETWQTNRSMRR